MPKTAHKHLLSSLPPESTPGLFRDDAVRMCAAPSGDRDYHDILILKEKVASLETWRSTTEIDLKEIRDVISQVKLLITLSIGGGGLSIITLVITISRMISR